MNRNILLSALYACLLAAAPLLAQTDVKVVENAHTRGIPALLGSTLSRRLETSTTTPTDPLGSTVRSAISHNQAFVHLFGSTSESASVRMALSNRRDFTGWDMRGTPLFRNTSNSSFRVRIAGVTVVSQIAINTPILGTFTGNAIPGVAPELTLSVLGIGMRVGCAVQVRADWDITQSMSFAHDVSVMFQGPVRFRANGAASLSYFFFGATAGTRSDLQLFDTTANTAVSLTPNGTVGSIAWTMRPIRLWLEVWASVFGLADRLTLIDYEYPLQSGTIRLQ